MRDSQDGATVGASNGDRDGPRIRRQYRDNCSQASKAEMNHPVKDDDQLENSTECCQIAEHTR
jgi:hypothetical protein